MVDSAGNILKIGDFVRIRDDLIYSYHPIKFGIILNFDPNILTLETNDFELSRVFVSSVILVKEPTEEMILWKLEK